jgi:hypothetical protein
LPPLRDECPRPPGLFHDELAAGVAAEAQPVAFAPEPEERDDRLVLEALEPRQLLRESHLGDYAILQLERRGHRYGGNLGVTAPPKIAEEAAEPLLRRH